MALTTLASQTHETLSKIHETIVSFTTDTSKRDARLEELEQDCKKHIDKLKTAFAEESSALEQKRKAEKDAIAEQRKKEDEERERKRRLEDEEMAMKAEKEDEERKKALDMETAEVKDTTESLKAQAEAQLEEEAQRRWEERNGRLKELREEINRLIEEQLQMPLPLPKRKSIWAAETSPRNMPMITSPASTPPVAVESKTLETLSVAAIETQPMSNPIVKANEDDSLPAAENGAVSTRDIDVDSESSLETLPRTTYPPDPIELSFAVPPVKISLATDVHKKEEGDRPVVEDVNNALGFVPSSLPTKPGILDVDEDEAIGHMSELRRVNSRDPSAERHAQLGLAAGAGDHDATDSESEYDEEEESAVGGRPRSASAELAWWEQQQRKTLESAANAVGQDPEKKEEQPAAKVELPKLDVLERAPVLSDVSRGASEVDEKPPDPAQEVAESSERSSVAGEKPSAVTEDVESPKPPSAPAEDPSFPTRELDSKTTEVPKVTESHNTKEVSDPWDDVKDNGRDAGVDAYAHSESEGESESDPEPDLRGDTGSFSPRPAGGDWPLRHDGANIDEARDVSRNATPDLKLDMDMFNKEPQAAPVEGLDANIEQAQAQVAVDSMISPTSTVERGFRTTSVATPISHIELMSKKVHDELDMVESSAVDVISMGSPFERGSSRSFDAAHDHDHEHEHEHEHEHSQLTADTSAADVNEHPVPLDRGDKAVLGDGSDKNPESGDKPAGDWTPEREPQIELAKRAIADTFDHSDGTSEPRAVSDDGEEDRTISEHLEPTQKAAPVASERDGGVGKQDSASADERVGGPAASDAFDPAEKVVADISDHDDVSKQNSGPGDKQADAWTSREDPEPAERALFDAAECSAVSPVDADADARDARHDLESESGWDSEDEVERANPWPKSLSEELAQDDSSEDPETLYDDDPLAVRSPEDTVKAEPAVQAAVAKTPPQQQDENKGAGELSSSPHEQLSDEPTSREQGDKEDQRSSVSDGEDKEKRSKPLCLSEELAHREREAHEDDMDSTNSNREQDPAKDAELDADKKKKDAVMDVRADAGSEGNAPPAVPPTENDAAPDAEADVEGKTVATPAAVTKEKETVPGVEVDTKVETVVPPAASSAEKDAVKELEVHARAETDAPIPAIPTQHAEEVADVAADKPETLETQPPVPTQEQTANPDVDVQPVGDSEALHPGQVPPPAREEAVSSRLSDSEHEDKDSDIEADKDTAKTGAVRLVEAAQKPQVPNMKDIFTGDNLFPPATGFTDGESQEFFTPMPSAGLRSPSADNEFLGRDTVDQTTMEATPHEKQTAEVVDHQETPFSQPARDIDKISDQSTPTLLAESVKADKLDKEIKADDPADDEHNTPVVEDRSTPVDPRHVSTAEGSDTRHDFDLDRVDEEAALNKVPTNETQSTNETSEQDSNNGYASSQHELELEDEYSATVHGQDHLFDSDEHTSGEDRDSGDEQYDKDVTPIDNVDNPFRDSAEGDDLDDGQVVGSDEEGDVQRDGFEVRANLSVVEKDVVPEGVSSVSRGHFASGDVDANVDDSEDDEVRRDSFGARAGSPDLHRNTQTHIRDPDQDERDTSAAPETMPAEELTSSESKIGNLQDETDVTGDTQQQRQQESVLASPHGRDIDQHDLEDETASDYENDHNISEQPMGGSVATVPSTTEVDDGSHDTEAQEVVLPEPVSPTATRGLAASRHNPERTTERPQTPEAHTALTDHPETSSSMPQNPFEGHDDADLGMETIAPRDVTNISWSSQATGSSQAETPHAQSQSRSRRDTDVESTPMSLRSASTLSSAPSSPVHASLLTDNHEPVIRDSWPSHPAHGGHAGESSVSTRFAGFLSGSGRPRGDSHLSNASTSEYMPQDVNPGLPIGGLGGKGSGSSFPLGPSPMRLWQRRDQGLADNADTAYHRPVSAIDIGTGVGVGRDESDTVTPTAASASATTATYRNSITGSGSGSGSGSASGNTGTGMTLFQRMRNVFENNSSASASASATTPSTPTVGGSRSNSPVVRSRPGSFYRSLEQHQQEQLAAKRLSGGLVRPGDVAAAYDRGHGHGSGYDDGGERGSTCGYDEVAGYLHHEHTTKNPSRRREGNRRDEYYDDDQLESDDDSGEDASLLEHGGAEGEYTGHGYGYDRHGRLTTAN